METWVPIGGDLVAHAEAPGVLTRWWMVGVTGALLWGMCWAGTATGCLGGLAVDAVTDLPSPLGQLAVFTAGVATPIALLGLTARWLTGARHLIARPAQIRLTPVRLVVDGRETELDDLAGIRWTDAGLTLLGEDGSTRVHPLRAPPDRRREVVRTVLERLALRGTRDELPTSLHLLRIAVPHRLAG